MHDPILSKSFSQNERKRFGYLGLFVIVIVVLSSCMISQPNLHPLSMIGDVMNLQLSIAAAEDLLVVNDTTFSQPIANEEKEVKPICNVLEARSDYCEIKGDIRILSNSSTLILVTHNNHPNTNTNISARTINSNSWTTNSNSWTIQPYPRKGSPGAMSQVKNWTVKLVSDQENQNLPKCEVYHGYPALLFSLGGYSGNHFHDFTDLIIPIFSASQHLNGDVHFLVTDYKKWWTGKYKTILNRLSRNQVIDIDKENIVQCFPSVTIGLKCRKELSIDPSMFPHNKVSMTHFKSFLRSTFSLGRNRAIRLKQGENRAKQGSGGKNRAISLKQGKNRAISLKQGNGNDSGDNEAKRPRLMIISRRKTRVLMNEEQVRETSEKLGYEVVTAEANLSTNLSRFAEIVNSCDVLMGVHGAGLTNMVFLPDKAVVIQVIPFGEMDGFARRDFGYPAADLNVHYLEYKIGVNESSLVDNYPLDHDVLKDPLLYRRRGWRIFGSIYLDQQNVRIDVNRFRPTLIQALTLLQH